MLGAFGVANPGKNRVLQKTTKNVKKRKVIGGSGQDKFQQRLVPGPLGHGKALTPAAKKWLPSRKRNAACGFHWIGSWETTRRMRGVIPSGLDPVKCMFLGVALCERSQNPSFRGNKKQASWVQAGLHGRNPMVSSAPGLHHPQRRF